VVFKGALAPASASCLTGASGSTSVPPSVQASAALWKRAPHLGAVDRLHHAEVGDALHQGLDLIARGRGSKGAGGVSVERAERVRGG